MACLVLLSNFVIIFIIIIIIIIIPQPSAPISINTFMHMQRVEIEYLSYAVFSRYKNFTYTIDTKKEEANRDSLHDPS